MFFENGVSVSLHFASYLWAHEEHILTIPLLKAQRPCTIVWWSQLSLIRNLTLVHHTDSFCWWLVRLYTSHLLRMRSYRQQAGHYVQVWTGIKVTAVTYTLAVNSSLSIQRADSLIKQLCSVCRASKMYSKCRWCVYMKWRRVAAHTYKQTACFLDWGNSRGGNL